MFPNGYMLVFMYFCSILISLGYATNISRISRQTVGEKCAYPVIIYGDFEIVNPNVTYVDNYYVPSLTIVKYTCYENYQLSPPLIKNIQVCIDGEWNGEWPKCIENCPTRTSDEVNFICTSFGLTINCSKAVEGTVMEMSCKNNFSPPTQAICKNGFWSKPIISCQAECGKRLDPKSHTFIVNSSPAKQTEFPWHVALYVKNSKTNDKHRYICGGSLIHVNLVLTVAHCITSAVDGRLYNLVEYYVGAGKYYSDYDSPLDKYAQQRNVIDAKIPQTYRGSLTEYASDIAVLFVNEPFDISGIVRLACIDWSPSKENYIFASGAMGHVAGWGIKDIDTDQKSAELRTFSVPSLNHENCLNETILPKKFYKLLTADKFCAGHINGSAACFGDSGGGIVFERKHNNEATYYFIEGLVSAGPSFDNGTCDHTKYSVYTNISNHLEFLKNVLHNRTPPHPSISLKSCQVPEIHAGVVSIPGSDYTATGSLPENSSINIACIDSRYALSPYTSHLLTCIDGEWNYEIPYCAYRVPSRFA